MVEAAVVVPGQAAVRILADVLRGARRSAVTQGQHEELEAALVGRGHEGQAGAVGGETRLEVDGARGGESPGVAASNVEGA